MAGVPFIFGNATTSIPLSNLDADFNTGLTIGNTTVGLGNTVTTLGNVTLTNVNIVSGTVPTANSIVNGTSNVVIASSGGAVNISTNGTQAITVDTSQNVGIGMTPVASYGALQVGSAVTSAAGVAGLQVYVAGTNSAVGQNGNMSVITTNAQGADIGGSIGLGGKFVVSTGLSAPFGMIAGRKENATDNNGAGYLQFSTIPNGGSTTERMRIDSSGNFLVGQTAGGGQNINGFYWDKAAGYQTLNHVSGSASGTSYTYFAYNASAIGSITQTGTTAVLYNTTSDYRLKTDVTPLANGLSTIQALNPVNFTWVDGRPDDGFLAHELQTVIPNCVTGEKDAVETVDDLDADGKVIGTKEVPKYQQIDNSGVIPFLVKAIQEQQNLITTLQEQVAALQAKVGV